ncbi:MAG: hypothetical protein A2677_04175 [Candidatus Komeilibacteria bacterium RIFCSPHIGHO2_01_FULL_52_14]|uniref:Uncharacterized protein n=1 Tax=Candidatus Komeilibacteria bacterium RIFCSPHIGHO2_01_FULL_52_14 TaxID=1798549 RepID=A0A1G2BPS7_9BACT|nr:MAG: hypothetical protein A2677_04175 [Candidatus Komeilibacteria bacterium RIFCSPHIGHO2_01_FULL_52_14]
MLMSSDPNIYTKTVHSGKWFALSTIAQRIINFFAFLILARLLLPADYGVISIVFLVTGIIDDVSTPGFGAALLQKKDNVEYYLRAVWTWDVLRSAVLAGLIVILSGEISSFFKIPQYHLLIALSGLLLVIPSVSNPKQLYFFKELDFKKIFIRDVTGGLVYAVAAVLWVIFVSPTAWALFWANVISQTSEVAMTYVLMPARVRFDFRLRKLWDLSHYSRWIYGQNLLNYFLTSLDKIFIARMLNSSDLGVYARAKDLPTVITSPVTSGIRRVGFAAFAKVQDSLGQVQRGFVKSVDFFLLVSVPVSVLLILEGGTLVQVFLGDKWLPISMPLKLFSIAAILLGLVGIARLVANAVGRPSLNFKTNVMQLIVSAPILYIGILNYGLLGAVVGSMLSWTIVLLYTIGVMRPVLQLNFKSFVPTIVSFAVPSLGTLLVDVLFRNQIHAWFNPFERLGWIAFLGLFYMAILFLVARLFDESPWHSFVAMLKTVLKKGEKVAA